MKLIAAKILNGASFWGSDPIVKCEIALPEFGIETKNILLKRWQYCQQIYPTLPDLEITYDGFARSFAWLAYFLQSHGRHEILPDINNFEKKASVLIVGVSFVNRTIALQACAASAQILSSSTPRSAQKILRIYHASTRALQLHRDPEWLFKELQKKGIPCTPTFNNFLLLGEGKYQSISYHTYGKNTAYLANQLVRNKQHTNLWLQKANLPVAPQEPVLSVENAVKFAKQHGYPVVLKPIDSGRGKNVFTNLNSAKAITAAFNKIAADKQRAIIEKHIDGDSFRILVVCDKIVAAVKHLPGHVTGNGKHTIRELLVERNKPIKWYDPKLMYREPIAFDAEAKHLIAQAGYTLDSHLKRGEVLFLRTMPIMATGGMSIDVTSTVHPDYIALAKRTAKTVGLDIMGLDIITTDISKPYHQTDSVICEVNACPGLRTHYAAENANHQDLINPFIDLYYPNNAPCRMTHIVVCSDTPSNSISEKVNRILKEKGFCLGFYTSEKTSFATCDPDISKQSLDDARTSFIHHTDLDICLWSLDYGTIADAGLPHDKIDLLIDAGKLTDSKNNQALLKLLKEKPDRYETALDSFEPFIDELIKST